MAPLFGLLAFLFNFIPNIGSIIATLLPIPIAFAQFEDQPWMILAVVGLPGTVHITIGNVVEPRLMGRGLELHPVTVLLALAFWGLLWGIVGMVLAVPIVAAMRIVFSHFASTRRSPNCWPGGCRAPLWGPCTNSLAWTGQGQPRRFTQPTLRPRTSWTSHR